MAMAAALGQVAGAGLTAYGQLKKGQDEATISTMDANMNEENARIALQNTGLNEMRQRVIGAKAIGNERAAFGASGVSSTAGSALDVMMDSAANNARDALNIKHAGEMKALGYQNEAGLYRARAGMAQSEAELSAASTLLGGFTKGASGYAGQS
jgi:hypothetical protein